MSSYLKDINNRYKYKDNKLYLFRLNSGILRKTFFIVNDDEQIYINDFVKTYCALPKRERKYIDEMQSKNTLFKCWYYCKVWFYTVNNLTKEQLNSRCSSNVIDHIQPIIKGFKNNIAPEIVGSKENIQFITDIQNLIKGSK